MNENQFDFPPDYTATLRFDEGDSRCQVSLTRGKILGMRPREGVPQFAKFENFQLRINSEGAVRWENNCISDAVERTRVESEIKGLMQKYRNSLEHSTWDVKSESGAGD